MWADPRERRIAIVVFGVACGVSGGLLVAWDVTRVEVRMLNTTADPAEFVIDRSRRLPGPTVAVETPNAGTTVRLSPGRHRLALERAGVEIDAIETTLASGGKYLFAPGEGDQCFFVEHAAYGEARPEMPALTPLRPGDRLWKLPDAIDAWFVPNPPVSAADKRSSGGTRTAVRQARCGFSPWK